MGKVNYNMKALTTLNVRKGPSTSYKIVGSLHAGEVIYVSEQSGSWFYCSKGWCCSKSGNKTYLQITSNSSNKSKTVSKSAAQKVYKSTPSYPNISKYKGYYSNVVQDLPIKVIQGIHGMPYQFMSSVDSRIPGTEFGRKYTERIISKMPLLLLTPGRPAFMTNYSNGDRRGIVQALVDTANNASIDSVEKLIGKPGRYYTFEFAYADYYSYVNQMASTCATYLKIDNKKITLGDYSAKLGDFKWNKVISNNFGKFYSVQECIAFYIDSENQVSESFSSDSKESMLSSKVNEFSDLGKEVTFLLGAGAGKTADLLDQSKYDATISDINSIANKYLFGSQIFKDLGNTFATVAAGGKLIFPEIWNDTTFSKSYDISLKLRSPDADVLSIYLNILIPLIHLICLVAPQQMGANGYKSPFLIRAFYKGLFNCDMGLITSMSITKGKESAWNINGLPTEVDVSLSLKDLYSTLSISNFADMAAGTGLKNTSFLDYLANMCGLNINKPEIERIVDMYLMTKIRSIKNIPNQKWLEFDQSVTNHLANVYASYFKY